MRCCKKHHSICPFCNVHMYENTCEHHTYVDHHFPCILRYTPLKNIPTVILDIIHLYIGTVRVYEDIDSPSSSDTQI